MSAIRRVSRNDSKATEVSGKLFFNQSTFHPKASMRQAAKRFVETGNFTTNCLYYDGHFVNGRWEFTPVGVGQSF